MTLAHDSALPGSRRDAQQLDGGIFTARIGQQRTACHTERHQGSARTEDNTLCLGHVFRRER